MGRTWISMMGEQMARREVVWIAGLQRGDTSTLVLEDLGSCGVTECLCLPGSRSHVAFRTEKRGISGPWRTLFRTRGQWAESEKLTSLVTDNVSLPEFCGEIIGR